MPKHVESGELVKGDYVLATKWQDGSSKDPWYVGYFSEKVDDLYFINEGKGNSVKRGFLGCKKIHPAIG